MGSDFSRPWIAKDSLLTGLVHQNQSKSRSKRVKEALSCVIVLDLVLFVHLSLGMINKWQPFSQLGRLSTKTTQSPLITFWFSQCPDEKSLQSQPLFVATKLVLQFDHLLSICHYFEKANSSLTLLKLEFRPTLSHCAVVKASTTAFISSFFFGSSHIICNEMCQSAQYTGICLYCIQTNVIWSSSHFSRLTIA